MNDFEREDLIMFVNDFLSYALPTITILICAVVVLCQSV